MSQRAPLGTHYGDELQEGREEACGEGGTEHIRSLLHTSTCPTHASSPECVDKRVTALLNTPFTRYATREWQVS